MWLSCNCRPFVFALIHTWLNIEGINYNSGILCCYILQPLHLCTQLRRSASSLEHSLRPPNGELDDFAVLGRW